MTEQEIVTLAEKHGLCTIVPDAGYPHDALWFDANLIEFAKAVQDECARKLELTRSDVRLMTGELTEQEMRTVMAVLSCLWKRMRSNV